MQIRNGELSPVAVVEAYLEQIQEYDDEINAYTTVLAEEALSAAREAERTMKED